MSEITQLTGDDAEVIEAFINSRVGTKSQDLSNGDKSGRAYAGSRSPWLITRVGRLLDGTGSISLYCNPTSAEWSFPLRSSGIKVKNGYNHHFWFDTHRNTYFDEAHLSITFQSGSIHVLKTIETEGGLRQAVVPPGHKNWLDFPALLNDRRMLDDGSPNDVLIMYNSKLLPRITVVGEFEPDSFSFSDTVDTPNSVEWSATLVVKRTIPEIWDTGALVESIRNQGRAAL